MRCVDGKNIRLFVGHLDGALEEISGGADGCTDTQAALWLKRAEAEETRTGALVGLATARLRAAKGLPIDSLNEAGLRRIMARGDVGAAYDRLARTLPERYAPALLDFEGV